MLPQMRPQARGRTGRRGGRRGLVVVSCATSGPEKLVGAATRPCAGRATLEWSRDSGRADLEGRTRLRSVVYVGLGSLRCQRARLLAGDQLLS